jgi:anti-sigma factor RsiW
MRCEDARAFISREADGELRDEQKAAARQHVEQCPDCARFLAHCRALQCAIEGSVVDAPSRLYWAGFSKRLSEQATTWVNSTVARMRLYRLVACAAAAACFVLLIGLVAERSLTRRLEAQIARSVASGFEPGAEPQGLVPATPLAAATSQQGLAEQAEAFRLVGDYFQGELAWMVQDGSQSELGLTGRPDAPGEER